MCKQLKDEINAVRHQNNLYRTQLSTRKAELERVSKRSREIFQSVDTLGNEKKALSTALKDTINSNHSEKDLFSSEMKKMQDEATKLTAGPPISPEKSASETNEIGFRSPGASHQTKEIEPRRGSMTVEQEKQLKKAQFNRQLKIVSNQNSLKKKTEREMSYNEALGCIERETGVREINKIVDIFLEAEENNFQVYKRIERLRAELDELQEEIAGVQGELQKIEGVSNIEGDKRRDIVQGLAQEVRLQSIKYERCEVTIARVLQLLDKIKDPVFSMVHSCFGGLQDHFSISELENISEFNVILIIGVVEQKFLELMQFISMQQVRTSGLHHSSKSSESHIDFASILSEGKLPILKNRSTKIAPPSYLDFQDEDSSDEDGEMPKPLGRAEMHSQIQAGGLKRRTRKIASSQAAQSHPEPSNPRILRKNSILGCKRNLVREDDARVSASFADIPQAI
jgi:hypothetical protein